MVKRERGKCKCNGECVELGRMMYRTDEFTLRVTGESVFSVENSEDPSSWT